MALEQREGCVQGREGCTEVALLWHCGGVGAMSRQWPEVSDFVARFFTLHESKNLRPCENRTRFLHGRRFQVFET